VEPPRNLPLFGAFRWNDVSRCVGVSLQIFERARNEVAELVTTPILVSESSQNVPERDAPVAKISFLSLMQTAAMIDSRLGARRQKNAGLKAVTLIATLNPVSQVLW
jgi:hypothetical protein